MLGSVKRVALLRSASALRVTDPVRDALREASGRGTSFRPVGDVRTPAGRRTGNGEGITGGSAAGDELAWKRQLLDELFEVEAGPAAVPHSGRRQVGLALSRRCRGWREAAARRASGPIRLGGGRTSRFAWLRLQPTFARANGFRVFLLMTQSHFSPLIGLRNTRPRVPSLDRCSRT